MKSKEMCLLAVLCCLVLASCSKTVSPVNYDAAEVGKVKKVSPGVIISMRPAYIRNTAPASTNNNPMNNENAVTRSHGFEYVIKLNNGAVISLVQTDTSNLKVQQRVLVIYGENTRIVSDDGKGEDW